MPVTSGIGGNPPLMAKQGGRGTAVRTLNHNNSCVYDVCKVLDLMTSSVLTGRKRFFLHNTSSMMLLQRPLPTKCGGWTAMYLQPCMLQHRCQRTNRRQSIRRYTPSATAAPAVAQEYDVPGMTAFLDTLKYNSDGHVAVIVQVIG